MLARLMAVLLLLAAALLAGAGQAHAAGPAAPGQAPGASRVLPMDDKCTDGSPVVNAQCGKSKGQPEHEDCDGWGEPAGFCAKPGDKPGGKRDSGIYDVGDKKDSSNPFEQIEALVFDAVSVVAEWGIEEKGPNISGSADDGGIAFARDNLLPVVAFVVVVALIAGAVRLAMRRDGRPLKDMVVASAVFVAVSTSSIVVVDLLSRFCQDFARWYVLRGLGGDSGDSRSSMRTALGNLLKGADSGDHLFVGIMAGLCVFGAAIAQWLYKMYAAFIVLYLVATMPLMAAGGMLGGNGSRAFGQHIAKTITWVLAPAAMDVVFVLSVQEYARASEAGGGAAPYRGIAILAFGTITVASVRSEVQGFLGGAAGSNAVAAGSAILGAKALGAVVKGGAGVGGAVAGLAAGLAGGGEGRSGGGRGGTGGLAGGAATVGDRPSRDRGRAESLGAAVRSRADDLRERRRNRVLANAEATRSRVDTVAEARWAEASKGLAAMSPGALRAREANALADRADALRVGDQAAADRHNLAAMAARVQRGKALGAASVGASAEAPSTGSPPIPHAVGEAPHAPSTRPGVARDADVDSDTGRMPIPGGTGEDTGGPLAPGAAAVPPPAPAAPEPTGPDTPGSPPPRGRGAAPDASNRGAEPRPTDGPGGSDRRDTESW
ncbi:hypothetical protein LO772_32095 [Yinghuangia sp. ASG 101]|uniref:hypothetical protein n=1 Tax=Yinghuangia sp. ASG 101 TaxID=2896848 RepID=UPI001E2BEABD|nr:hypothetical protein [Yinghuangia sp. ASG 101]UGQ11384.1 hypothetical protein LO772_32095 [Yinghuangia sp. ASG 101]